MAIALIAAEEAQRWAQRAADFHAADTREAVLFAPIIDEHGERNIWIAANELGVHLNLPDSEFIDRWMEQDDRSQVYYLEHLSRCGKLTYDDHLQGIADVFSRIRTRDGAIPEDWTRWATDAHAQCIKRAIYIDVNRDEEASKDAADIAQYGHRFGECTCQHAVHGKHEFVRIGLATGTAAICKVPHCQRIITSTFVKDAN